MHGAYKIGRLISSKEIRAGLSVFAIISASNVTKPRDIHGMSDYEDIISIVAELQHRYATLSIIMDKHTAPTMYGPRGAIVKDIYGKASIPNGGYIGLEPGDIVSGYATWDAALSSTLSHIDRLEKHLYALSEMGPLLDGSAFGNSQGYEALSIRLVSARAKARRLTTKLTPCVKKLLSLLTGISDIVLYWNNGVPYDEEREA